MWYFYYIRIIVKKINSTIYIKNKIMNEIILTKKILSTKTLKNNFTNTIKVIVSLIGEQATKVELFVQSKNYLFLFGLISIFVIENNKFELESILIGITDIIKQHEILLDI